MASNDTIQLQPMHLDVLTEVGNIGSGNAAAALAAMMNTKVEIKVPVTSLVDFHVIGSMLGGDDTPAIGIRLDISGDLNGMILHVLQPDFASKLVNTYYPTKISTLDDLSDMDQSVVGEMGNITSAAYVNALAAMTDLFINISPPALQRGSINEILRASEADMPKLGQQLLFIDERLHIGDSQIDSSLLLMLDIDSLKTLFERLQISY